MAFLAAAGACAATWLLLTHYEILGDDAQLYALQAMARLHPERYANDLFLAFGSQDRFTFFTPIYAGFIHAMGLAHAAALLTLACHVGALVTSWFLVRRFTDRHYAILAIALLIAVPGTYGAGDTFQYRESFLTARLPAEVAVIAALACWFYGRNLAAAMSAVIALALHPLMAAPGVAALLLMSLSRLESRRSSVLLAASITAIAGLAVLYSAGALSEMPDDWLGPIRARSAYMFPSTWDLVDWSANLVPMLSAAITALVLRGSRISQLTIVLLAVALGGVVAALLFGDWLPLTLVVQIQSWRWVWLLKWVVILFLPSTLQALWNQGHAGRCAGVTLGCAWLAAPPAAIAIAGLALCIFLMRALIPTRAAVAAAALAVIAAVIGLGLPLIATLTTRSTRMQDPWIVERLEDMTAIGGFVILCIALAWWLTVSRKSIVGITLVALVATLTIARLAPRAWDHWTRGVYTPAERAAFADWRRIIPAGSNVLWIDNPDAVWFLLDRASYVSQSQSAGMVFSANTAREIRRRAAMLQDFVDTRWLISLGAGMSPEDRPLRPLTASGLAHACRDKALQFVVSRDDAGPAISSTDTHGLFPGFRLYACGTETSLQRGM